MCCGASFGPCIAEGCSTPIRCQDTGGFCDEHAPDRLLCDCDGECACPPSPPRPAVNAEKKTRYDIQQLERWIRSSEASLARRAERITASKTRLTELRAQLADRQFGDV